MRKTLLALCLVALSGGAALAQQTDSIRITEPWARATPGRAANGAAYLTITNTGTTTDRLVAASTPAAQKAEVHEMLMDKGVMQMRAAGELAIEPGKSLVLKPGGYHLMLMGLKQPLKAGDNLALTLTFEKAGAQQVIAKIGAAGAMGPASNSMGHDMSHMGHDMNQHKQ